jgi:small subunit ribosomal protein S2
MNITIKELLEAGVHFGHQTRRWNPKMKKFIFTSRNGIYIIDLQKTLECLQIACQKVREVVGDDKKEVLFVGTKKQAKEVIHEEAKRCGMPYVTERWLGGMLTNFLTIRQNIKRLKELEEKKEDGTYEKLTKKEVSRLEREREKLEKVLGGIKQITRLPGLLVVVDSKKEKIAVAEANKLKIPVVGLIDTNSDPDPIDFPIAGNDDAIKSIKVITREISNAVLEASKKLIEEKEFESQARSTGG